MLRGPLWPGLAVLPLAALMLGCGQPTTASSTVPQTPAAALQQDDSLQRDLNEMLANDLDFETPMSTATGGISQSTGVNQSASGGGISQSSDINQSTSGSGTGSSSSVSTSQQTIDNGDGTVTIIETRTIDGKTETTRKTIRRTEMNQAPSQSIEQRIEQK